MSIGALPLLVFAGLYLVTRDDNVVSLVHALFSSSVALVHAPYMLQTDGPCVWGRTCALVTGQYMLCDLWHVRHWTYRVHHVLAIMACTYVVVTGRHMCHVLCVEVNEVSTVFLSAYHLNVAPAVTRLLFVVTFVLCRTVWLQWLMWYKPMDDAFLTGAMYVHYAVNAVWLVRIAHKFASTRAPLSTSGALRRPRAG